MKMSGGLLAQLPLSIPRVQTTGGLVRTMWRMQMAIATKDGEGLKTFWSYGTSFSAITKQGDTTGYAVWQGIQGYHAVHSDLAGITTKCDFVLKGAVTARAHLKYFWCRPCRALVQERRYGTRMRVCGATGPPRPLAPHPCPRSALCKRSNDAPSGVPGPQSDDGRHPPRNRTSSINAAGPHAGAPTRGLRRWGGGHVEGSMSQYQMTPLPPRCTPHHDRHNRRVGVPEPSNSCARTNGYTMNPFSCAPPPPVVLTRACPNAVTPCFHAFGLFLEPPFLQSQSNRESGLQRCAGRRKGQ